MNALIVEDDSVSAAIFERILRRLGHETLVVPTAEEALVEIHDRQFELIIIDLGLEGIKGDELCRRIRDSHPGQTCFIVGTTASSDMHDVERLLDAGADSYLAKPFTPDYARVRLRIVANQARERLRRNEAEERLAYLATHDTLTGLVNRNQLKLAMQGLLMDVHDRGAPGAVICIDLDNFKLVNDSFGHAAGDTLLRRVAEVLRQSSRPEDIVVRAGGDEFVIVQHRASSDDALAVAERIRAALDEMVVRENNRTVAIGASLGVSEVRHRDSANEVLRRADTACFEAKTQGRNRVVLYSGGENERRRLRRDVGWHKKIRDALRDRRLVLHYQPIFSLANNRPVHHEVLVRLQGKKGRLHLPQTFLPAAERFHLMPLIDRYILSQALSEMTQRPSLICCINLAGPTMNDPDLPQFLIEEAARHRIHPSRVVLEVTENEVIANMAMARHLTTTLQQHDFRFSLDDFGAGFSSFTYLKHLPVDFLKIDGHFIRDLTADALDRVFVRAMNDIAHHLDICSIAEWVEDAETLALLRKMGVDYVQGNYLHPAAPLEQTDPDEPLTLPQPMPQ